MKVIAKSLILLALFGVLLAACTKETPPPITATTPVQDLKAPDWITKGGGAFTDPNTKGKVFYGVGSASGIKNMSLLRSTADNRARNDIAKVFQVYTSSLQKDYLATTTAGDPNKVSEEQNVELAIKTVTAMTLNGVQIVDHWQHPATLEYFSLARINMEEFKDTMEKAKELDQKVKEYVKQNADKLHDQLEKQEQKVQQ